MVLNVIIFVVGVQKIGFFIKKEIRPQLEEQDLFRFPLLSH